MISEQIMYTLTLLSYGIHNFYMFTFAFKRFIYYFTKI